jgi:hypothetical protein
MTLSQTADMNMFRNVLEFLEQEQAVINLSVPLKEDYEVFKAQMGQLDAKFTTINGFQESAAANKVGLKNTIAEKTVLMFSFLRRHAFKSNDEPLQKQTDVSVSSIRTMSDNEFIEFCKKTDSTLRQNEAVLTAHAVTAEEQTALLTQLNQFKSLAPQVKLNQSKRAVTIEDINESIKSIRSLLTNMMDVSVKTVSATNPEFVRHYDLVRVRREPSKSVTQVLFVVQNQLGDMPLSGVQIVIPSLDFEGLTDNKGQLTVKVGNLKTLTGTCSLSTLQTQDVIVSDIVRGSTTTCTVKMKVAEAVLVLN